MQSRPRLVQEMRNALKHGKTPSMASHSDAQMHSGTRRYLLRKARRSRGGGQQQQQRGRRRRGPRRYRSIKMLKWKQCRQLRMACGAEEGAKMQGAGGGAALDPGRRYGGVSAVEEKQHVCRHSLSTTRGRGKVIGCDDSVCTLRKRHSSFGTGSRQMHTVPRKHTHILKDWICGVALRCFHRGRSVKHGRSGWTIYC